MKSARDYLEHLLARRDLSEPEAASLLSVLLDPATPQAMAGALLTALRMKGETAGELRGLATAMRSLARLPDLAGRLGAIDVVGTGGDASGSFNLSTAAALLVAAMGLPVVKHGNRAVSSRSGSADLLEALGLPLPLDERAAGACLRATGFTFLFAPHYHPAMRALAEVRRALGVRTVFNLLGPLTNPAAPPRALIGACDGPAAQRMADALSGMPIERAFVVHGAHDWDEATPVGPFVIYDVRPGRLEREVRDPAALGLPSCRVEDLAGGDAAHNARALVEVLSGRDAGPHEDAVVLNAALALEVAEVVPSARAGIARARDALREGAGARLLERLEAFGASRRSP